MKDSALNFYNGDVSTQFMLRKDTVRANDIVFTDYYLFHARELSNDPDHVVAVYMKPVDGIIAYKTISGNCWTSLWVKLNDHIW